MTAANIALVQSLYAAFGRGDIEAVLGGTTPDIRWEVVGRAEDHPTLGVREGREAVREFFGLIGELHEILEFTPREFYADGDTVIVTGQEKWRLRGGDKEFETAWVQLFTIRGGKVASFREFTDTAQLVLAGGC